MRKLIFIIAVFFLSVEAPTRNLAIQMQEAKLEKVGTKGRNSVGQRGTGSHWGRTGFVRISSDDIETRTENKDQLTDQVQRVDKIDSGWSGTYFQFRSMLQRLWAGGGSHGS